MKHIFVLVIFMVSVVLESCENTNTSIREKDSECDADKVALFGVASKKDAICVLSQLIDKGRFQIYGQGLDVEGGILKYGAISMNGVPFGVTPIYGDGGLLTGFVFNSSDTSDVAYDKVRDFVIGYYGESEEVEWRNCFWSDGDVSVKLRPLRSDDGGLVLLVRFGG